MRAVDVSRRRLLAAAAALPAAGLLPRPAAAAALPSWPHAGRDARRLLADLELRTFRWFWDTAEPTNGLVRDRFPTPSACSVAAVGFGLTAVAIGAERGYVTRPQAADRVRTTLRFLLAAPQGPEPAGTSGYKGFFYHFIDMNSGHRAAPEVELSTVDTALLLAGVLHCQSFFDRPNAVEAEIRSLADALYRRVEWPWMQWRAPALAHGWFPEPGFINSDWIGYNEAMIVYILALGSPTHPVTPEAWEAFTRPFDTHDWRTLYDQQHLVFPPLFGHQYSHVWIDFRGIRDGFMRDRGLDYFENSRRATLMQRSYAIDNPMKWAGYGPDCWGLTACDGPANGVHAHAGEPRTFRTYSARGAGFGAQANDDGTLAPTAAAASLPFAPEIAIPAVVELHRRYGEHVYDRYGFLDAFNPSFDFDATPAMGRTIPGFGWVAGDYLAIDQGPIVAMLANHGGDLVWRVTRRNPYLVRGLQQAGFSGGWLRA